MDLHSWSWKTTRTKCATILRRNWKTDFCKPTEFPRNTKTVGKQSSRLALFERLTKCIYQTHLDVFNRLSVWSTNKREHQFTLSFFNCAFWVNGCPLYKAGKCLFDCVHIWLRNCAWRTKIHQTVNCFLKENYDTFNEPHILLSIVRVDALILLNCLILRSGSLIAYKPYCLLSINSGMVVYNGSLLLNAYKKQHKWATLCL